MRSESPFKFKQKRNMGSGVGCLSIALPKHKCDLLRLWALYYKETVSNIIFRALENHENRELPSLEICESLAVRAYDKWKMDLGSAMGLTPDNIAKLYIPFIKKIKVELSDAKLNPKHIDRIIEMLNAKARAI